MGLLSGAANAYFTYKFLRLLTQKWEDTDAYELGIVDENGKTLKKLRDLTTPEEKDAYSMFNRLAFNLKRIIQKLPFGSTRLASYASALFLIKEHTGASDEDIQEILESLEADFDVMGALEESKEMWFISEGRLSSGTFTLTNDILSPVSFELAGRRGTSIISEGSDPVGNILGINIYKVKHISSGQDIFVTDKDIKR